MVRILIVSDPHYVGPSERGRKDYEACWLPKLSQRLFVRAYRRFFWMKDPLIQTELFLSALEEAGDQAVDWVVLNGDLSLDTGFVGVSDPLAFESARLCLNEIWERFDKQTLRVTLGDHDLGKMSMMGGRGGMRIDSLNRFRDDLDIEPCWHLDLGSFRLMGICSSLVALPAYQHDLEPEEKAVWYRERACHLNSIQSRLESLGKHQRLILFCHDPTALPFLLDEQVVTQAILDKIERTVLGHLHSPSIFSLSSRLAGMKPIRFLGRTGEKISKALQKAGNWTPFKPILCPSPGGIQLCKDGGYLTLNLDLEGMKVDFEFHPLSWKKPWPDLHRRIQT